MEKIDRVPEGHGRKLVVFEDSVYCECEYTILVPDKSLAACIEDLWESDNFSIYL